MATSSRPENATGLVFVCELNEGCYIGSLYCETPEGRSNYADSGIVLRDRSNGRPAWFTFYEAFRIAEAEGLSLKEE